MILSLVGVQRIGENLGKTETVSFLERRKNRIKNGWKIVLNYLIKLGLRKLKPSRMIYARNPKTQDTEERELLTWGHLELHSGTLFQNKNKNVSKPLGGLRKHG